MLKAIDKVKNNTYIWNINSFKGKKIYLKFDKSKKSGFNYNIVLYLFIILTVGFIVFVIYNFIKNRNRANDI